MSQELTLDNNAKSPAHLLKRVNGVQRVVLFYDPDLFTENLTVSVSLLTGEDVPFQTHYNTLHEPDKPYGAGIHIHAVPPKTKIIGLRRVLPGTTGTYFLADTYDADNQYTYSWTVTEGTATLTSSLTRRVGVRFGAEPHNLTLECTVTNADGGTRTLHTLIHVGAQPKKLLVVRGTKFTDK